MNPTRTRSMLRIRPLPILLVALALLLLAGDPVVAQQSDLASQSLGRPYRFVFLAYAILWVLVFGWVFSVGRRISRLAEEFRD